MKAIRFTVGATLAAVGVALILWSPAAVAAKPDREASAKLPDDWPYEMRDGRRVPKGKRVTAADGSWREEIRDGDCVTIREKSAKGEYREARRC